MTLKKKKKDSSNTDTSEMQMLLESRPAIKKHNNYQHSDKTTDVELCGDNKNGNTGNVERC